MDKEPNILNKDSSFDEHLEELYHSFVKRIKECKSLKSSDRDRIEDAYELSEFAHKGQFRAGGEAYFEHPRAVALILIDECHIEDPDLIITALLHDAAEDSSLFANPQRHSYDEWKKRSTRRINRYVERRSAKMILTLSKPPISKGVTKEERAALLGTTYYRWLNEAIPNRPQTILVKMADRLHNLRTLNSMPEEKQKRKIEETKEVYLPRFKKLLTTVIEREHKTQVYIEKMSVEVNSIIQDIKDKPDDTALKSIVNAVKKEVKQLVTKKTEQQQILSAGTYLLKEIERIVL